MIDSRIGALKLKARKWLKPRKIKIQGLWFSTNLRHLPEEIRKDLYNETYEGCERHLTLMALRPDDRVLEIGAGIGFVSMICASICGPGSVLSYEPNPNAASLLKRNFELNGMRANVRERGIAVKAGYAEFYVNKNILSSSIFNRSGSTLTVVTFDALQDVVRDFKPSVVVMDAEGAEIDLLPLVDPQKIRTIVVEMHPHIVGAEKCHQLVGALKARGYHIRQSHSENFLWLEQ